MWAEISARAEIPHVITTLELAAATNEHKFYTQNTFLKKSGLSVGSKGELSIICYNNVTVPLENTLIVKTAIWQKVEAFFKML